MKWSKADQEMLSKLQGIERARRSVAEARLALARAESIQAVSARDEAQLSLTNAEAGWAEHHARGRFDLDLARMLGSLLVSRARELGSTEEEVTRAEAAEEGERDAWRALEASVRSGEKTLKTGRRMLVRRSDERRDQALSERTTWRWFQR